MASGPAAGLALVEVLISEPSFNAYHLLPSERGDLLAKLDRFDEARVEFERTDRRLASRGESHSCTAPRSVAV